ncbi:MAG: multidrug effflux MFS transporter [Rhodobiaceae bacterium]|nr:multidrug effflux MFS transporter [Rhodobiaceae bacterium]
MNQTSAAGAVAASQPPPLILLVAISAIGPIALNIFMPSMPGMQSVFGVDYATVQLTLTFYLFAMAISQLVFGPLSDRFGRKPMLVIGLACFITGSVLATLAPTIELLIAARLVQGLGGAAGVAIGRAIVRDCYSRERSASMIGYVTMGMVVGPMVSPYIGGRLDEVFGWQAGFVAVAGVALPVLVMVVVALRETRQRDVTQDADRAVFAPLMRGAAVLFRSRAFWGYALAMGFASAAFFSFLAAAPYLAVDVMGLSPSAYGTYFPLGAVGYMLGNFLSGKMSERAGPDRMILAGNIIGIAATAGMMALALGGALHPLALFVPMAFVALSNGLVLPNAIASCVSIRPEFAGAASGLSGALQLLVGGLSTILAGHLQDGTLVPISLVMAGTIWLSVMAAWYGRRALRRAGSA